LYECSCSVHLFDNIIVGTDFKNLKIIGTSITFKKKNCQINTFNLKNK